MVLERRAPLPIADDEPADVVAAPALQLGDGGDEHVDALAPVVEVAQVADDELAVEPERPPELGVPFRCAEGIGVDPVRDDRDLRARDAAIDEFVGEDLRDREHAVDVAQDPGLHAQAATVLLRSCGKLRVGRPDRLEQPADLVHHGDPERLPQREGDEGMLAAPVARVRVEDRRPHLADDVGHGLDVVLQPDVVGTAAGTYPAPRSSRRCRKPETSTSRSTSVTPDDTRPADLRDDHGIEADGALGAQVLEGPDREPGPALRRGALRMCRTRVRLAGARGSGGTSSSGSHVGSVSRSRPSRSRRRADGLAIAQALELLPRGRGRGQLASRRQCDRATPLEPPHRPDRDRLLQGGQERGFRRSVDVGGREPEEEARVPGRRKRRRTPARPSCTGRDLEMRRRSRRTRLTAASPRRLRRATRDVHPGRSRPCR